MNLSRFRFTTQAPGRLLNGLFIHTLNLGSNPPILLATWVRIPFEFEPLIFGQSEKFIFRQSARTAESPIR